MIHKVYTDHNKKDHWPDANSGDDLYYAVNFGDWMINEGGTLVGVTWTLPVGVTSTNSFVTGTVAHIKLATPTKGLYSVVCNITILVGVNQQVNAVPLLLKVY